MSEPHARYPIAHPEDIGEARRFVGRMAEAACLPPTVRDRAAAAVGELGSNLLRHAEPGGYLLVRVGEGIEVLAVDRGPGIRDVAQALQDRPPGNATSLESGGLGVGLGAVRRTASAFDVYSLAGDGTVVYADFRAATASTHTAGISVPKLHGDACGDRWGARVTGRDIRLLVVDGLGHGAEAAAAAVAAVGAFDAWRTDDPRDAVLAAHKAMVGTRGGVLTVCRLDPAERLVSAAGLGNITVRLTGPGGRTGIVPSPGTAGTTVRAPTVRIESGPWPPGTHVVMYSDGIGSGAAFTSELLEHHPAVVAAVLYRDHARGTDDATVLVCLDVAA